MILIDMLLFDLIFSPKQYYVLFHKQCSWFRGFSHLFVCLVVRYLPTTISSNHIFSAGCCNLVVASTSMCCNLSIIFPLSGNQYKRVLPAYSNSAAHRLALPSVQQGKRWIIVSKVTVIDSSKVSSGIEWSCSISLSFVQGIVFILILSAFLIITKRMMNDTVIVRNSFYNEQYIK